MIATIILIIVIISIATVAVVKMSADAKRIHGAIDDFLVRANEATTIDELVGIRQRLIAYVNKECWHRTFTDHAREVLGFINGRIAGIKS